MAYHDNWKWSTPYFRPVLDPHAAPRYPRPMQGDDIRAIIREELAHARDRKRLKPKDPRPALNVRLDPDEYAAVDAYCAANAINRSDLIRSALAPILGRALRSGREIPANFRRRHNHTKPSHFTSPETNDRDRDAAMRRAASLGIERETIMRELRAASAPERIIPGMLTDAGAAQSPRKLSRS